MLLGREPVAYLALLRASIILGLAFGLDLSEAQQVGIYLFAEVLLAFLTRQQVSPVPVGKHAAK